MKRIILAAAIAVCFDSIASANTFQFDFYGNKITVDCRVPKPTGKVKSFNHAVIRDMAEAADCMRAIKYEADRIGASDFAEILFMERFVASLTSGKSAKGYTGFSSAVTTGTSMSRNDRIALLYAMIAKAGYGIQVVKSSRNYVIFLQAASQIDGTFIVDGPALYAWEPGEVMGGSSALVTDTFSIEQAHDGASLKFDDFSDAPWAKGVPGKKVKFESPEGCPASWNFERPSLPDYQAFLQNWPRGDILGKVAYEMMKPYELDKVFGPTSSRLDDVALGNCLFEWIQINTRYPEKNEEAENTRLAAETLFGGVGDCDEQAFVLIAVLMNAGVECSRIRMAVFDEGGPNAHMNLIVSPLSGELPEREDADNFFVEIDGVAYYFMDVASYVDVVDDNGNKVGRELVKWGDLRENLPDDLLTITVGDECE